MKIHYIKLNELSKLHDEILKAGITPERIEGLNDDIWITVSDLTPQTIIDQINTIVSVHVATPIPQPPTAEEKLQNDFDIMFAQMLMLQGVPVSV